MWLWCIAAACGAAAACKNGPSLRVFIPMYRMLTCCIATCHV